MRARASQSKLADPSTAELVAWRRRRLQRAGFNRGLAARLASNRRFDLHAVLELIDQGCSPELAARIIAPVDDEPWGTC